MNHTSNSTAGQLSAAGYVGAGLQANNVKESPLLDIVEKRFDNSVQHAYSLVQRISQLADRLVGAQPKGVAEGTQPACSSSSVSRLESTASSLQGALNIAFDELQRLERL